MEEATFLARVARSVTIIHRHNELRASKIMQQRAMDNPKITLLLEHEPVDILAESKLSGLVVCNTKTGEKSKLNITGLFVSIGHEPRSELLRGRVELDAEGYVKVAHPTTETNLSGVFACGEVVDHIYRQAVTAAGTGCAAALDAERFLAALEGHAGQAADGPKRHRPLSRPGGTARRRSRPVLGRTPERGSPTSGSLRDQAVSDKARTGWRCARRARAIRRIAPRWAGRFDNPNTAVMAPMSQISSSGRWWP
jgi:hypothetical protein